MLALELPVGFERFHRRSFIDYQLNRIHALGWGEATELRELGARVQSFEDVVREAAILAEKAEAEGRGRHAVGFWRLAEFFTPPSEKPAAVRRFRESFDGVFPEAGRVEVPYGSASLPAYRLVPERPRGTVLVHGGFDSLIEEFLGIWSRFAEAGWEVIAFEGPGQGAARALGGLTFDHDWERPVAAILDHFGIDEAALVGISMGGYWCLRAASREPRISRVVSWPPVYDWLYQVGPLARWIVRWMVKLRWLMNWTIRLRTRLIAILRHAVRHAMYSAGGDEPMDAVDWLLGMNRHHLGSERVTQDVLILAGGSDRFQPPKLARLQEEALVNARSVTRRVFTDADHAGSHCQMGNLPLAIAAVTEWLEAHPPLRPPDQDDQPAATTFQSSR